MHKATIQVGFVQTAPVFGAVGDNVGRAMAMVEGSGADIIVLPELFPTGYLFEDRDEVARYAEQADGPLIRLVSRLAAAKGIWICGGFAEKAAGGAYNAAFLVGPAGLAGVYRKSHLFGGEKDLFLPGDTGFRVFDTGIARVGVMICFDWVFPEAARTLALRGAEVILHPSNLVLPHCPDAMVTRCLENRVYAVTADRVGSDARAGKVLDFIGQSQVTGCDGAILSRASRDQEEVHVVGIDPALARDKHATPRNDLFEDRRPDLYEK